MPATESEANADREKAPRPRSPLALVKAAALATALLLIAALAFRALVRSDTDLPSLPALGQDAREVYLPALRSEAGIWSVLVHRHDAGAVLWKRGWLALDQQWDARLLGLANTGLLVLAAGVVFVFLARSLPARRWLLVLLATFAGAALYASPPPESAPWLCVLVALSVLHLGLMTRATAYSWPWWTGFAAGLLNVVASTEGIASAAALLIAAAIGGRAGAARDRAQRVPLAVANAALLAPGLALLLARVPRADAIFANLGALAAWPFAVAPGILLVWVPALVWVFFAVRRRAEGSPAALPLAVLWVVLQLVAVAAVGLHAGAAAAPVVAGGLLANLACLAALPAADMPARTRKFVFLALWSFGLAEGLLFPAPQRLRLAAQPPLDATAARALRAAIATGDTRALEQATRLAAPAARELAALLAGPELRRVLPFSIRPPVAAGTAAAAAGGGLRPGAVPAVFESQTDLPLFGTWGPAGGAATGEFVSEPFRTTTAFLETRLAGDLAPPETTLLLRGADGAEFAPWTPRLSSPARLRTIHFSAPPGAELRLVLRDASAVRWIGFTAPVELGRLSWLARKILAVWPWLAALGGALAALSAGVALFRWRRAPRTRLEGAAPEPRIAWGVVPWLALIGYALFFVHHIDPVAGPNDASGYLNSAKLLASGQITGAPRMIEGLPGAAADITPYLPVAFRATADGRMAPDYPVGLPLIFAAAAQVLPLADAVPAAIFAQFLLGVLFTWLLARTAGLPRGWSWLAAGLVGLSPVYLFMGLQPMSDGPAMVWVTAAVFFAWSSRDKPWHAVLAGLATALAVLIRPANALCVLPIAIVLSGRWRQVSLWIAGGLPGAAWLLWYQQRLYGNPFVTGYGDAKSLFGFEFISATLWHYVVWLPALLTPFVVLALAGPFVRSIPARTRLALAVWAAAFFALYTFHVCTHETWWYFRFLLPAFPPLAVLTALVARAAGRRFKLRLFDERHPVVTGVFVLALAGLLAARSADLRITYWLHANQAHATAAHWARENLPRDAVVFTKHGSGSLAYYTDLTIVDAEKAAVAGSAVSPARVAATGRPVFALLYRWEGTGDGTPALSGRWERIASIWDKNIFVWRRLGDAPGVQAGAR